MSNDDTERGAKRGVLGTDRAKALGKTKDASDGDTPDDTDEQESEDDSDG